MNCFEIRRRRLVDPSTADPETSRHEMQCRACREHAAELRELERLLARTIRVPVPEALEWRILARHSLRGPRAPRWPGIAALAATVVLAVALVILQLQSTNEYLAEDLLAYLANHAETRTYEQPVPQEHLTAVLAPLGLAVDAEVAGPVADARPCQIRGRPAAHLVLAGDSGSIDVLVMPEEAIRERRVIQVGQLQVLIVPCPRGSMAIVGRAGETLSAVEARLRAATAWI